MGRHGENIHKRKDGRWEARYIHHYDNNRAVYRSVYGKSYLEAKEKRKSIVSEHNMDCIETAKIDVLFKDLATIWLNSRKGQIKESTLCHYNQILQCHILPRAEGLRCGQLKQETITEFVRSLGSENRQLSPKTILDICSVLRMILSYGKMTEVIDQRILVDSLPKQRKRTVSVLTREEQQQLESVLREDEFSALTTGILLALYTGLRIGEICGLKWADIQSSNGSICVSRTVLRITNMDSSAPTKTKLILQNPKSESSIRCIPMPNELRTMLERHRQDDALYVITESDRVMDPRLLQKKFQILMDKHNIKDCSFHTLRHTFATRCIESGMDIKSLSEIMGHASVTTTMQMYVHPSMDTKRQQLNKMEQWMMVE